MFVIDFDDTLFDTQGFKQARLDAVRELGVSDDVYWETYLEARNSPDGLFTYSNERHAEMISLRGFNEDEVLAHLQTTTGEELENFLFPTTCEFLDELKKYNQPMVLLSLGEPAFQELKVKGSCIDTHFDRMFMVDKTKEDVLRELFTKEAEEKTWFINDKVSETTELVKKFPKMKAVLRVSLNVPLKDYDKSKLPFFETLEEILNYIKQSK